MNRHSIRFRIAVIVSLAIAISLGGFAVFLTTEIGSVNERDETAKLKSSNDMLMQFQADILNVPVLRPKLLESTAWGAAAMAGLKSGVFSSLDEIAASWQLERAFEPKMSADQRGYHLDLWQSALKRAKSDL